MWMDTHLQVAFGCERLLAHRAHERPFAGVRAHVDLQRRRRAEVLLAQVAKVLLVGVGRTGRRGRRLQMCVRIDFDRLAEQRRAVELLQALQVRRRLFRLVNGRHLVGLL